MRIIDWIFLLALTSLLTVIANLISTDFSAIESILGMSVLSGIALAGVVVNKVIPKFPIIINISVIGLLLASGISPASEMVIESTSKIGFMAPIVAVGALAGIGMGENFKAFTKQGWQIIVVVILVYFSTFFFSALIAHVVMLFTGTDF